LLPGKGDVWLNLAILKDYSNIFNHWLCGDLLTTANYPEGKIFLYNEPTFLSGPIFWCLLKFTGNDHSAFIYLYIIVYTLDSWVLALFLSKFCKVPFYIAALGALTFNFSAFSLGLTDNLVYSIFFPVFAGLYLLELWLERGTISLLYLATACLGIQIYFSVYNFFMGALIAVMWFASTAPLKKVEAYNYIISCALLLVITGPFIYLFGIHNPTSPAYQKFLTLELIDSLGFRVQDLFHSFHSNIIYGQFSPEGKSPADYWHLGNVGLISSPLAIAGFFFAPKSKRVFITLILITGIIFSFGTFYQVGNLKSPLYYLMSNIPFLKNFKLIFKFYYLIVFAFSICFTFFLKAIEGRLTSTTIKGIAFIILITVYMMENMPGNRLENSSAFKFISLNEKEVAGMQANKKPALILPAYAPVLPDTNAACFSQGRLMEYKYYYLQTHYNINLLNGMGLFAEKGRQKVDSILNANNLRGSLEILQSRYNLGAIVFDKTSALNCGNPNIDSLKTIRPNYYENEDHIYFR